MFELHTLKPGQGSRKGYKVRGRGDASGRGSYSGRGIKGQRARIGGKRGLTYLGIRRTMLSAPKLRGFRSLYAKPSVINVGQLQRFWQQDQVVSPDNLLAKGLIHSLTKGVKILGEGEITAAYKVEGCQVSESAKEKIIKAGGSVKGE